MTVPHLDRNERPNRSQPPDSWYGALDPEELRAAFDAIQADRQRSRNWRRRNKPGAEFYLTIGGQRRPVVTARVSSDYL